MTDPSPTIPQYVLRTTYYVLRTHKTLLLILAIFSLLTLYNSILLPLGEAADETDHYQYLRFVARTGHPPFTAAERDEAGFKGGLAPLYYWITAWPVALIGEDTVPDVRRVDARPERFIPGDGLGINHVLHTLDELWPWRGQPLAWHLGRFLSLPMGMVTIIATYLLAQRLFPTQPLIAVGAAAFIAVLPRFVISSAVINDDNLVFALTALLLLVQVIILQGDRRPRTFALFGGLFGLTLITKYFSLILIPTVIFTLVVAGLKWQGRKVAGSQGSRLQGAGRKWLGSKVAESQGSRLQGESSKSPVTDDVNSDQIAQSKQPKQFSILNSQFSILNSLLAFLLSLALIAGPWFTFIVLRFNRVSELGWIPGLAASLGEPQITEGLAGLLSGQVIRPPAATYSLPEWLGLLYRSFWFEYGWMRLFAPTWVYLLFSIFLGLAIIGLIRSPKLSIIHYPLSISILLGLHVALFVLVVGARYILSATIDTGQGRHLYPALPVIAIFISTGAVALGTELWGRANGLKRIILLTAYCLLLTAFLGPALLVLQPGLLVRPNYRTIPVTVAPPEAMPIQYRHDIPVGDDFSFVGFTVENQIKASQATPVTLYWRVAQQVNRDYLVSLCWHDGQDRPVGCAVRHVADGHYPARAWEANDLIADTIHIPIPTCYRILDQAYRLHLELWPLQADSLQPVVEPQPVIQHTFAAPDIAIRATDSLLSNQPQTIDLWQAGQRLTGPVTLTMNESLNQISYRGNASEPAPAAFTGQADHRWQPLAQFSTDLYLPCDEGP
ncbi:MAG: glycosyltransferase family 39 protein, partial [Anaerolineae bacterium]|nr:glycosyltransferase family 39 protein [Anaerolineae bacterium]